MSERHLNARLVLFVVKGSEPSVVVSGAVETTLAVVTALSFDVESAVAFMYVYADLVQHTYAASTVSRDMFSQQVSKRAEEVHEVPVRDTEAEEHDYAMFAVHRLPVRSHREDCHRRPTRQVT